MSWDVLFHVGDLVVQCLIAWAVIPVAMRVMAVLKDFPPHRHEANGTIRYPAGFEPGRTERLGIYSSSATSKPGRELLEGYSLTVRRFASRLSVLPHTLAMPTPAFLPASTP